MKEKKIEERVIEPNQPLDLNQIVMQRSTQIGTQSVEVDNRSADMLDTILWCWIKDSKLKSQTIKLPEKMSIGEAKENLRRESKALFPLIQEIVDSKDGTVDKFIEKDYYHRLMNELRLKFDDLQKQGILNWGVDLGGDVAGVYLDNAKKR